MRGRTAFGRDPKTKPEVVYVFCKGADVGKALQAGAAMAGGDELVDKVSPLDLLPPPPKKRSGRSSLLPSRLRVLREGGRAASALTHRHPWLTPHLSLSFSGRLCLPPPPLSLGWFLTLLDPQRSRPPPDRLPRDARDGPDARRQPGADAAARTEGAPAPAQAGDRRRGRRPGRRRAQGRARLAGVEAAALAGRSVSSPIPPLLPPSRHQRRQRTDSPPLSLSLSLSPSSSLSSLACSACRSIKPSESLTSAWPSSSRTCSPSSATSANAAPSPPPLTARTSTVRPLSPPPSPSLPPSLLPLPSSSPPTPPPRVVHCHLSLTPPFRPWASPTAVRRHDHHPALAQVDQRA